MPELGMLPRKMKPALLWEEHTYSPRCEKSAAYQIQSLITGASPAAWRNSAVFDCPIKPSWYWRSLIRHLVYLKAHSKYRGISCLGLQVWFTIELTTVSQTNISRGQVLKNTTSPEWTDACLEAAQLVCQVRYVHSMFFSCAFIQGSELH